LVSLTPDQLLGSCRNHLAHFSLRSAETKELVSRALELLVRRCHSPARLGINPPRRYIPLNHAGKSLQAIANHLNGEGFTTRRNKPWNKVQVKLVIERGARLN
jgi:hypothetical protein